MKELTYNEVERLLNDGDLFVEDISQPLYNSTTMANAIYDITIICGDWKHDHGYLDFLMRQNNYYKTREDLIHDEYTEDGDDCYSATHRFVYKPYYELFNGKVA